MKRDTHNPNSSTWRSLARSPAVVAGLLLLFSGCGKDAPKSSTSEAKKEAVKQQLAKSDSQDPETIKKPETAPASGQWGNLRGRFVVDGDVPKPAVLTVLKDIPVCCKDGCPRDDSLVVGKDGGLANVIVYVRPPTGHTVAIHDSYGKDRNKTVVMDNTKCMFSPHVVLMRTSQTLVLRNSDPVGHNANIQPMKGRGGSIMISAGSDIKRTFEKSETIPATVVCNIHPWMKGYVLARDNPYFALTGSDGSFEIKNLPAGGTLVFQLWHERSGYLRDVDVNGQQAKFGRVKIKIEPGDNDLGTIKVPAALLKK